MADDAVPDDHGRSLDLRRPRYGAGCVTDLLTDAAAAVTHRPRRVVPLPDGLRAVVVVIVDGLGRSLLDRYAKFVPHLTAAPGTTIDAAFPSSTATNLTSIGTGRAPVEHGIVGTSMVLPGVRRPLTTLRWSWEDHTGSADARRDAVPEHVQPTSTLMERAHDPGIRWVTVHRPEFADSGLSRASLRGGLTVVAEGLEATCRAAVAATSDPGPTVVYAHHGDLDEAGHLAGPGSERWITALQAVDGTLARIVEELPRDVAIVVSADHGMVAVPDGHLVDLADEPDLVSGVRVVAGEPRARQLHVRRGARDGVLATWRERVGDLGAVVTRDRAIVAGWFGPPDLLRGGVAGRIGDVLAVARTDVAWVHRDLDPMGGRLLGQHGALTADELRVPALVLRR